MSDRSGDPVSLVASEIVRYLESHPEASDGRSGIRDFWLGGYPLPGGTHALDAALERLVMAGVLKRVRLPGGDSIFRFVKAK